MRSEHAGLREFHLNAAHELLVKAEESRRWYEDRSHSGDGFREALRNHEQRVAAALAHATLALALREGS